MAIAVVVVIGITAQIEYTDAPFLPSSASECDCIVNVTTTQSDFSAPDGGDGNSLWRTIYKVSYMYYSLIGTGLTVFFGLAISMVSDAFTRNQILKVKSLHDFHPISSKSPALFSVSSFTLATGRKLSSFIHHVAHDVSQSTLKVENKLKEVISHTNLHLHGLHGDAEDRISILNEEENRKMFFIGEDSDEDEDGEELIANGHKRHVK